MSYTPTVWETGNVVTAQKLNKLENGLQTVAEDADDLKSNITESTFEQSKNICPNPTASTNGGGYLNGASGSFGAVEQGKTYTFSATNITNVGKALSLRLLRNGAWVIQVDVYATENARFSATFTAITFKTYFCIR